MRRRDVLQMGAGLAAGAVGFARTSRANDFPKESDPREGVLKGGKVFAGPVKTESIAEGLTLLTGPGGNMLLAHGGDGPLLVDCALAPRVDEVRAAAEKAAGTPVRFVVNTHWHGDHTGGNLGFARAGATILATPQARQRLAAGHYNPMFRMNTPAQPVESLPALTLTAAEFRHGTEEIGLQALPPAHTDGDLFVHFHKADVIHGGDVVGNGWYPNIDVSSKGWIGGMIAATRRILEAAGPKTRFVPGHGPVATVDDVRAYLAMLVSVYDRVAPMVDKGKTVDEVLEARPTAAFDDKWGGGLFNGLMFTRLVYVGLVDRKGEPVEKG